MSYNINPLLLTIEPLNLFLNILHNINKTDYTKEELEIVNSNAALVYVVMFGCLKP